MQTNPGPRIKILTAVLLGIQASWNVTLCCWVKDPWHFKGVQASSPTKILPGLL